jgi:hypothetical protein
LIILKWKVTAEYLRWQAWDGKQLLTTLNNQKAFHRPCIYFLAHPILDARRYFEGLKKKRRYLIQQLMIYGKSYPT